jgi:ABC-type transport system substrate-binding protein
MIIWPDRIDSEKFKNLDRKGKTMTLLTLTRRAALAGGAALALALSSLTPAMAQTPPGVLIVGQVAEPQALDPHAVTAVNDFRILMNVYDGLVRYAPGTLEVEPALASAWDVSEDGTVYTFSLRDGVTFHDGSALRRRGRGVQLRADAERGSPLSTTPAPSRCPSSSRDPIRRSRRPADRPLHA